MSKTIIEMAREAGGALSCIAEPLEHPWKFSQTELERFAARVREDERNKFTAVGEVKDGSFGGFVWNEGITSDEAPDGAVLYVRSMK